VSSSKISKMMMIEFGDAKQNRRHANRSRGCDVASCRRREKGVTTSDLVEHVEHHRHLREDEDAVAVGVEPREHAVQQRELACGYSRRWVDDDGWMDVIVRLGPSLFFEGCDCEIGREGCDCEEKDGRVCVRLASRDVIVRLGGGGSTTPLPSNPTRVTFCDTIVTTIIFLATGRSHPLPSSSAASFV
jgi:hypothetical protein